jgi:hypothetical protein
MSNTRLKHGEVGEEHNIHLTKAVSHCDLAICIKKYLKAKEELWKLNSNISPCKNIPNLQKNPLKETKILQDIIITL